MEEFTAQDQLDIDAAHVESDFTKRMFNASLAALRAQNPFIPILPFPNKVVSLFLAANAPKDLHFPEGTKLVRFRGNNDYYVSLNGNAAVPTATDDPGNFSDSQGANAAMYKPENEYYLVEELKSISIVAPNNNTIVTVHCYQQL